MFNNNRRFRRRRRGGRRKKKIIHCKQGIVYRHGIDNLFQGDRDQQAVGNSFIEIYKIPLSVPFTIPVTLIGLKMIGSAVPAISSWADTPQVAISLNVLTIKRKQGYDVPDFTVENTYGLVNTPSDLYPNDEDLLLHVSLSCSASKVNNQVTEIAGDDYFVESGSARRFAQGDQFYSVIGARWDGSTGLVQGNNYPILVNSAHIAFFQTN